MNEVNQTDDGQQLLEANRKKVLDAIEKREAGQAGKRRISRQRAQQEGLDQEAVDELAIRGEIEIRCQICDVLLELGHDGDTWLAREKGRFGVTELLACSTLCFTSASLPALATRMKDVRSSLEAAANVDEGLRVRFAVDLDPTTEARRMRELLRSIWDFSGSDVFLLIAEKGLRTRFLNTKQALRYLKRKHGLSLSREALYMGIRRGRLAAYVGAFRQGGFRPMVRSYPAPAARALTSGRKIRGSWAFAEEDLNEYVSRLRLPDSSVQAVIALSKSNEELRIRGPHGEALTWLNLSATT